MTLRSCLRLTATLLLGVSFTFGVLSTTAAGQSPKPPFEISWTAGSCHNCQFVRSLGDVAFTGTQAIWALGYYFPTEGEGAGDNSVVRSTDSDDTG
jgi:hypothetical protein